MSYLALARKWRPKLFTEVVGQTAVLKIITHGLSLSRVHHAYLFSGTRGVGKTSIARLFAKSLNCEAGITTTPCCQCNNCKDLEQGCFIDLIEIDAASRTKVEDTKEILDGIQYLPTRGRFKVYLIDEVHMLSRNSFNALLKTLEEPPKHVKFLLATTDPKKLPITILSRCLHLYLRTISTAEIMKQLERVLQSEQISYHPEAIQLLAKNASGSMRDGLSLTEQAIALGNGQIDLESVKTMLGSLDENVPFSLIESLISADSCRLMEQLLQAAQQGTDLETVLIDTLYLLHQIAMAQLLPVTFNEYQYKDERIGHLAKQLTPQDIQLYYQILLEGKKDLDIMDDKQILVEMTFLRALAFQPKLFQERQKSVIIEKNRESISTEERKKPVGINKKEEKNAYQTVEEGENIKNSLSPTTQKILEARNKLIDHTVAQKSTQPPTSFPPTTQLPKSSSIQSVKVKTLTKEDNKQELNKQYQWKTNIENGTEQKQSVADSECLERDSGDKKKTAHIKKLVTEEACQLDSWTAEIEELHLMPLLKQIAMNAFLEEKENDHLVLHLRSSQTHMNKKTYCDSLQNLLSVKRHRSVTLQIIIDDDITKQTPVELRHSIYKKKLSIAQKKISSDEKVYLLCQYFDAQIDEESISPV